MRWPFSKTEPSGPAAPDEGGWGARALNSPAASQPHSFTLTKPIYSGPQRIETLTIRAPTAADFERLDATLPDDIRRSYYDGAAAAIALLTGLSRSTIESISARDFLELCDGIAPILEDVMKE